MGYQFTLRQLEYFLEVSRTLHFRQAAENMHVSQPGLSRQVRQLESVLDVKLLDRDQYHVSLTAAGKFLFSELESLVGSLDQIIAETKLIESGKKGVIRMGYVGSAMHSIIPELLHKFANEYPEIRFNLTESDNKDQIQRLLDRQMDIGFVRLSTVPFGIELSPVHRETFSLVIPDDHQPDEVLKEGLSSCAETPFILFEKGYSPTYFERVMSIFEDAGFVPQVSHESVHATTIFKLVEMGFGYSIVPSSMSRGYEAKVRFVELEFIPQRTTLFAAWNKDIQNPALKQMLEELPTVE